MLLGSLKQEVALELDLQLLAACGQVDGGTGRVLTER